MIKTLWVQVFVLTFLFFTCIGFAQKQEGIRSMETEAHRLYAAEQFGEALPIYLLLDSLHPGSAQVKARIGIAYLNLTTKYRALNYLQQAKSMGYAKDGLDYYLGRAYHLKHEFDKAIEVYTAYKNNLTKTVLKNKDKIKEMDDLIAACNVGKELKKNPVEARIVNLGPNINSAFSDFAPVINADETVMIFTSKRPNSGNKDENGDYYEDIFVSNKVDGEWTTPKNLGNKVNTKVNDASIGLSLDGQQLFIYKNDTLNDDDSGGDIFTSDFIDNQWSKPKRMSKGINSPAWEPSASLNADETVMFFSSDRNGGYGGTDIYICKKLPGKPWGVAKNAGPLINTKYDEDAPFIHPDSKTLYFSSNGPRSMGGFDIFTSDYNKKNDSLTSPVNIGYPVNTADDEMFFVWSADGKRGYFSASREDNYGEEDIYIVHRPNIKIDLVLLNGRIRALSKIVSAKIKVIDNANNKMVAEFDSTTFLGNYTLLLEPGKNYTVSIEADNYLPYSENIDAPMNGFFKIEKNVEMAPLNRGGMITLSNVFFQKGDHTLKTESFWELDRYSNFLKGKPDLAVEIAAHATDFGNDEKANLLLSKKRAKTVADYLATTGLDSSRIKAVGYGSQYKILNADTSNINTRTELVVVHNLKEGALPFHYDGYYHEVKRTELAAIPAFESGDKKHQYSGTLVHTARDKHQLATTPLHTASNKQLSEAYAATHDHSEPVTPDEVKKLVETGALFPVILKGTVTDLSSNKPVTAQMKLIGPDNKILAKVTAGADGKYIIKSFQYREQACTLSVSKNGYNFYIKPLFVPANSGEKVEMVNDMYLKKLDLGTKFTLRNIYYDFDRTSLKPESFRELDHLDEMLRQNPKIKIEIAGHTDSRGHDYYNKILSQRRAEAVVNYLAKKGIDTLRIVPKGYGEERPFASNDDEAEGRELNRRTEILILKNH